MLFILDLSLVSLRMKAYELNVIDINKSHVQFLLELDVCFWQISMVECIASGRFAS